MPSRYREGHRVLLNRKGVVRSVEYDLLSRPVRHKTHDVTRRFVDGSGYVDTTTYDIASLTIYDKNSNLREGGGTCTGTP